MPAVIRIAGMLGELPALVFHFCSEGHHSHRNAHADGQGGLVKQPDIIIRRQLNLLVSC